MRLYVANLKWEKTSAQLEELFSPFGCESAYVKTDGSGRSSGYGFVEISDPDRGAAAVAELNNRDFGGRPLRVEIARARRDRVA